MSAFSEMMQQGFEKKPPNAGAFVLIPSCIAYDIGFETHKGARVELALLSGFVFHAQRQAEKQKVSYNTGEAVEVDEDVFIVSMLTVIEDLYYRWFCLYPTDNEDDFMRFYERCKKAIGRLVKGGYIDKRGYVNETALGTKGTFWSFTNTHMQDYALVCEPAPPPVLMFCAGQDVNLEEDGYINVVDLLSTAFVSETHEDHTHVEISTGISEYGADRGRYMDYKEWSNIISNGTAAPSGDRHMSVGALVDGHQAIKDDASYFIPHFIFDVDGDDPFDSYETAKRVVDFFTYEMNVNEADLIVAYTGGDGFHIMVPSGLVGNPVFRNHVKAKNLLLKFKRTFLQENVDANLFDPRHLVRMIGSQHQKTGMYKTAYTAEEFRSKSIYEIIQDAVEYKRFEIPDPTLVPMSSDLSLAFMFCADSMTRVVVPKYSEIADLEKRQGNSEVIEMAMKGVSRKQVWYSSETKEYTGRNFAMFIAACYLIKKNDGNEYSAYDELKEVNQKNDPPLSDRELRLCFESAMKTTGYARNRRR